jgi:hypothetical protein
MGQAAKGEQCERGGDRRGAARAVLCCALCWALWVAGEARQAHAQAVLDAPTGNNTADQGEGEDAALKWTLGKWEVAFGGFIRTAYIHVQQPSEAGFNFIGENNGFSLLDMRLGVLLKYADRLVIRVQLDGTDDLRESVNSTIGEQRPQLRDAFVGYSVGPWLSVLAGQIKPPVDVESILDTRDLVFIRRSVVSDGVRAGEGLERYGTEGFGRGREVGLHLLSRVISVGGPVGLLYQVSVTNGDDARFTRNDNNMLAYYGRLELHLSDAIFGKDGQRSAVVIGGGAGYNENTPVQFPRADLLNQRDTTWGVDLRASAYGADLLVQFLERQRSFPDLGQVDQKTRGLVAQVAYRLPIREAAFQFAYRYASLDPFVSGADATLAADDSLTYHTLGLAWRAPLSVPLDLKLNYTITQEEGAAAIANDLIEGLVQVIW